MNDDIQIREKFTRLSEQLDSAAYQASAEVKIRENLSKHAEAHARFLAQSREVAPRRVVL